MIYPDAVFFKSESKNTAKTQDGRDGVMQENMIKFSYLRYAIICWDGISRISDGVISVPAGLD